MKSCKNNPTKQKQLKLCLTKKQKSEKCTDQLLILQKSGIHMVSDYIKKKLGI